MDCRILRHVTLKADGHVGCDDSIGYKINLGHVSLAPGWKVKDVFNGPVYQHVRRSFKEGRVPWPGVCEVCDLLSDGQLPTDTLASSIELLIEPTLACNISCACCLRRQIVASGRTTQSIDPAIVRRLMASCAAEGIGISQVHYIGWGEPLMHDDFPALFAAAKEGAPKATHVVTTAGNVDFRASVGASALDRIVVSCDGAFQDSYEKYRRGGRLDTVLRFMRDCRADGDPRIVLEWKYILFEHNDSDAELLRAQALADEIGVDSLLFIITNSKWHSLRFKAGTAADVPITSPLASVSPAAAMNAVELVAEGFSLREGDSGLGYIDRCNVSVGRFLTVEGWALDPAGAYADAVELLLDGRPTARTRTTLERADVAEHFRTAASHGPLPEGGKVGFMFRLPVPGALPEEIRVRVSGPSGCFEIGGRSAWRGAAKRVKDRNDMPDAVGPAATPAIPVTSPMPPPASTKSRARLFSG